MGGGGGVYRGGKPGFKGGSVGCVRDKKVWMGGCGVSGRKGEGAKKKKAPSENTNTTGFQHHNEHHRSHKQD